MAANPDYMPTKEAELNTWLSNFSALLTATPLAYGLTAPDAVAVAAEQAAFSAALAAATEPATRTKVTVRAKDTAKQSMLTVVRRYATAISANPDVSAALKTGIGVTVKKVARPRNSVVGLRATLSADSITKTCWMLRFQNPDAPGSKKLPPGAFCFYVRVRVRNADDTADEFTVERMQTRNPANFALREEFRGRKMYVSGWFWGADLPGGALNMGDESNELSATCP
jgi:hypothetical protein